MCTTISIQEAEGFCLTHLQVIEPGKFLLRLLGQKSYYDAYSSQYHGIKTLTLSRLSMKNSTDHTPPAELRALEMIRQAYEHRNYVFFSEHKYDLNIGGIRSSNTEPNRFDDSFFVAFIDERSTWRVAMWSCTTDPGLFFLNSEKMGSKHGTAVLIPGQYRRCWKIGTHGKKKYP